MFSGGCRVSFLDLGRGSLGEKKSVMWATSVFYRGIKIVNQLSEPRRKFPPNSRAGCCQSLSDLGFVMICSSIKPCRGWVRKGSNPSLFLRSSGSFPAPEQAQPCRRSHADHLKVQLLPLNHHPTCREGSSVALLAAARLLEGEH